LEKETGQQEHRVGEEGEVASCAGIIYLTAFTNTNILLKGIKND